MISAKFVILLAALTVCYGAPNAKLHNHHLKIAGVDVEIEDFPWVASIQICPYKCEHICSAVIINENWVLTGSNCIEYIPAQKVVAGAFYLNQDEKVTVDIEDAFIHPDAPEGNGPNDLALLKLSQPLIFNEQVQPAKLPKLGQEFTGKANVTGFGDSKLPGFNSLRADLGVTLISNDECKAAIVEQGFPNIDSLLDNESNLCSLSEIASTCYGDVGGPLSQDGTVIGTVGWYLEPCGASGAPNLYNKLSYFVDWIEKTVTENS